MSIAEAVGETLGGPEAALDIARATDDEIARVCVAMLRLGDEAAVELALVPDTALLRCADRAFLAAHPPPQGGAPGSFATRMLRLLARYREACGLDRAMTMAHLAELYAAAVAGLAADEEMGERSGGGPPSPPSGERAGVRGRCALGDRLPAPSPGSPLRGRATLSRDAGEGLGARLYNLRGKSA